MQKALGHAHSNLSLSSEPPYSPFSLPPEWPPKGQLSCRLPSRHLADLSTLPFSLGHEPGRIRAPTLYNKAGPQRSKTSFPKLQRGLSKFLARATMVLWCSLIDHISSRLHEPRGLGVSPHWGPPSRALYCKAQSLPNNPDRLWPLRP